MSRRTPSPAEIKAIALLSLRFQVARPWRSFVEGVFLAFLFPGDEEPWFGVICVSRDGDSGIFLTQGIRGVSVLRAWTQTGGDVPDMLGRASGVAHVGFTLTRWKDLPPGQQARLTRAGVTRRRDAAAPLLMAGRGGEPCSVDARWLKRLLLATAAVLDLHARDAFHCDDRPATDACLTLTVRGTWRKPVVETSWVDYGVPANACGSDRHDGNEDARSPPELKYWLSVERAVADRTVPQLAAHGLPNADVSMAYFGDAEGPDQDRSSGDPLGGFLEWIVAGYRGSSLEPTLLESLLDEHLAADEREFVEARIAAAPAFWKIVAIDPAAGMVACEDVLGGAAVETYQPSLANDDGLGLVFAATPIVVGGWTMLRPCSPVLLAAEVKEAFAFLESHGLEFSHAGLRSNPHLIGRLWQWCCERDLAQEADAASGDGAWRGGGASPPLQMQNSSGEPLEFYELLLRTDAPGATRKALEARDDIDFDANDDAYIWCRRNDAAGARHVFGDNVVIGSVRVRGDEIRVSVNSADRAAGARKWLEAIPGVRFESERVSPWDARRDTPLADRLPDGERSVGVPPELTAQLRNHFHDHYRAWLDEPVPALGNRTPRQAAKLKHGRVAVARLIDDISAPMPGVDLGVLRAELLSELGIE